MDKTYGGVFTRTGEPDESEQLKRDIERLTRERDAARAALKTIADHGSTESDFPHCVAGFQNYARRALGQTAPDASEK